VTAYLEAHAYLYRPLSLAIGGTPIKEALVSGGYNPALERLELN